MQNFDNIGVFRRKFSILTLKIDHNQIVLFERMSKFSYIFVACRKSNICL
ncbi:hypothetical protein MYAER_3855 [Microcystis aeruginosa NIES-2549]|uniref:Uncharacterized protein n=1 Tax=Microcystis aeruginosa NIES-2549 TaxID=1641812 RepID=A0A0F6RN79_MICAE|nr:hypothetical protein MYAER_3855 [Microcystis aeruginosa NIES-2549]AOC54595.1 hypothetical protein amyaer_3902 [Microcystis aeruginosa NIES-2481]